MAITGNLAFQAGAPYMVFYLNPVDVARQCHRLGHTRRHGECVPPSGPTIANQFIILKDRQAWAVRPFLRSAGLVAILYRPGRRPSYKATTTRLFSLLILRWLRRPGGRNVNQQDVANDAGQLFQQWRYAAAEFQDFFGLRGRRWRRPVAMSGEAATGARRRDFPADGRLPRLMLDPLRRRAAAVAAARRRAALRGNGGRASPEIALAYDSC